MINILFFIAGIALGIYIKGKTAKTFTPKQAEELGDMREEAREALTERTEKRKKKILDFMKNQAVHQKELMACEVISPEKKSVTSTDIEKLLEVTVETARKYLNELESEGKIKQIGEAGRGVYYTLNT